MRALLLLLGVSSGIWIDVPFVSQDKNGCGSAVIWMVMQYWGAEDTPSIAEVQQELYSPEAGGIFASDMEKYFQDRRFQTFAFHAEWADLEQHLAEHRPLIVCLEKSARGAPLHYVVVVGVDSVRQLVWLNDPAGRKLVAMSRREFEQAWMDNWTLLALPEETPARITRSSAPIVPGSYGPDMDLASTAFRAQRYSEARRHVRSILRSQPSDAFANDLMATIFYLENNLDASLKYWNRAGRPAVRDIRVDPELKLDPVLLERTFAFSRASILQSTQFRETAERLAFTGVFTRYQLELEPTGDSRFDIVLRAGEKGGLGLSWLRGLPYETVHPELFNLRGRAINVRSLLRWDANRRRAWVAVSAPVKSNPSRTYSFEFDTRDEEWDVPLGTVPVRKGEFRAQLRSIVNDRWIWSSGAAVARTNEYRVKYLAEVKRTLVDVPERRFRSEVSTQLEVGGALRSGTSRFGKIAGTLQTRWLPQPEEDLYEFRSVVRAGKSVGRVPFDELFVVGMDRDQGLWMRGHEANHHSAYAISNLDLQRRFYQGTFWGLSAGPFLDTGFVSGESDLQWDAGLQLRLNLLGGVHFDISYGRDLRSGENMVFTISSH